MHYIYCFTHCLRITAKGAYGHVSLTSFSLCCRVLTCLLCPSAAPRSNPKGIWRYWHYLARASIRLADPLSVSTFPSLYVPVLRILPSIMSDIAPRIQICGRCHHAGHRAYACPSRPDSSSATDSPVPRNRRPPDACWSCGQLHYSDECAIQAQRKANKQCII